MKKNPSVLLYLLITFLISYGLWGLCIFGQRAGWFPTLSNWYIPVFLLGGNAPAIATFIILKRADPDFSFKKFLLFSFDVKQKLLYYALTAIAVALFFIVPYLVNGISSGTAPGIENQGFAGRIPLYITIPGIILIFFGGGSEEIGWRGVLQPELEKKMPLIPATLIVAVIWTVWHIPLWFINGTTQAEVNLLLFFIGILGSSFALAAVRRISGSVFLCIIIHCATNSLQGTWPIQDDLKTKLSTTIALILFSLYIVYGQKAFHKHRSSA
jgi:membrane protease YdiL (CAAX protease family)